MGTVVSVENGYTMTIRLAGDTTSIAGVRYFGHYAPEVGAQVWVDTDGADLICIGAIAGLGGAACAARVYKTGNQNITTATGTLITYSTIESDPFGAFDNTNDRFVLPLDGLYAVTSTLQWAINGTGSRGTYIEQNGTIVAVQRVQATTGVTTITNVSTVIAGAKGDLITTTGYQTSGATLAVEPSGVISAFTLAYLGPQA